jgi:plastocyanin domain-containing protein
MKNKLVIVFAIILIIGFGIFMLAGPGNTNTTGNTVGSNENAQIIKLSVSGSSFIMNPSEVKVGIPVRIEADMSKMPGCSKSIVISSFNVRKTFTSTDNTVEFTPDKAGTFNIVCSMNMYKGTFTVVN